MTAKMYTLLLDMVKDQWVDLEASEWWIISINKDDNTDISNIIWTLKNILETKDIQSNQTFSSNIAEMIDTINSRIDLWISTDELTLLSQKIEYFELSDESIQKGFTGSFQWSQSAFDLSFMVSKELIGVRLYDIREYNEDVLDWEDIEKEFVFSLQEDGKSEYLIKIESLKLQQKVVDLQWKIEYLDKLKFSADFILEPLEIMAWEKISWKFDGYLIKKAWDFDKQIPEISGNVLSWNELLSSL